MVEAADKKSLMTYRYLGNTGIKVSSIGYGTYMNLGRAPLTFDPQELTTTTVKKCLEYGVNYFDTCEGYDGGRAEVCLGKTFKELNVRREEVVVSLKTYFE